jgi:hypothetical protein
MNTCKQCGKELDPAHPRAKFCSNACNKQYLRTHSGKDIGKQAPIEKVKPRKEGGELFSLLSGIQEPVQGGYRGVDQESGYVGTDISEEKKVADIAPAGVKKPVVIRVKEVMKVKEVKKKSGYVPPSPMEAAKRLRGLYNKKLSGMD